MNTISSKNIHLKEHKKSPKSCTFVKVLFLCVQKVKLKMKTISIISLQYFSTFQWFFLGDPESKNKGPFLEERNILASERFILNIFV